MTSVEVGIDELTVVLQSADKADVFQWEAQGEAIIDRFLELSRLEDLFGKMDSATSGIQQGYSQGLTFANRPWHFGIYWHEDYPGMGICIKFSAWAWAIYVTEFEAKYGTEMNAAVFLQMIQDVSYMARLSRIDLTADFFDYPSPVNPHAYLSPDTLYRGLEQGDYVVGFHDRGGHFRKITTRSALNKGGVYETVYVGGMKGKARAFLRFYEKRNEQISNNGFRYERAIQVQSWVRFEAVFKHDYAHQIGVYLLCVSSKAELQELIASLIAGKYMFYDTSTGEPLDISEELAGIAKGVQAVTLSKPNTRDNSFLATIEYIRHNSGLYTALYKAFLVWGQYADQGLMNYLLTDYLYTFKEKVGTGRYKTMERELDHWYRRHGEELSKVSLMDYLPRLESYGDPLEPGPEATPL